MRERERERERKRERSSFKYHYSINILKKINNFKKSPEIKDCPLQQRTNIVTVHTKLQTCYSYRPIEFSNTSF